MEPVAICAPAGRDGTVLLQILRSGGVACCLTHPTALAVGVAKSEFSLALLTEEALFQLWPADIETALSGQPLWSDFQFIVLTSKGPPSARVAQLLGLLGNVSPVERPVHPATLIRMVRISIRARHRQHQARHYLEEREVAEVNLRELASSLEELVMERTHDLAAANALLTAEIRERTDAQERMAQMQGELIHISRVSAMGTMASTLAHELNQPLTAVMNYVRGSIRLLRSSDPAIAPHILDGLEDASTSAHRAGEIVRRLRELVSRGAVDRREENLPVLIDEAVAIGMVDAVALGVTYTLALDPGASRVLVDRIQIQQVLINLIRNAVDAMHGADRREIAISTRREGDGLVEVTVADTGPGLTPKTLTRLFSSFNSTKDGGMGIGLSICRTIVEANGGSIMGENRPDQGAIFRFTLRAGEQAA